jgi:hypothetical protein
MLKVFPSKEATGLADSIERHLLGMMGGTDLVKPNSDLNNQLGLQKYKNYKVMLQPIRFGEQLWIQSRSEDFQQIDRI